MLVSKLIYHVPMTDLANLATTETGISIARTIQIISQIGIFILPPIVLAFLISDNPSRYLGFEKKPAIKILTISILIMFTTLPLIHQMASWNEAIKLPAFLEGIEKWMLEKEQQSEEISKKFLEVSSISGLLLNLLMIGILPAVGEELLFRSVLQPMIGKTLKNMHLGIIISAILFSMMHLQFYGFIPRVALGMLLGYFYLWSGSILVPMLMHLVNNGSAVILFYVANNGYADINAEEFGSTSNSIILIISIFISVGLCYFAHRANEKIKHLENG